MNLTEFAAARVGRLADFTKELRPIVERALDDYASAGGKSWATHIVNGAGVLWLETWEKEHERDNHPQALDLFRRELLETLLLAGRPDGDVAPPAQIDRITNWVGIYTVNSATYFANVAKKGGKEKDWVTMEDDRVRHAHRAAAGQKVPLRGTFDVGGVKTHFPGEPVGPIENWINCRCLVHVEGDVVKTSQINPRFAAQPAAPVDEAEPPVEDPAEETPEDGSNPYEIPIHGVAAPLGVISGDGRRFTTDASVTTRQMPLPFAYQPISDEGHKSSSPIGRVDKVWVDPETNLINYSGVLDANDPLANEFIEDLVFGKVGSVSVDLGDLEMAFSETDTWNDMPVQDFTAIELAGITGVSVGAFAQARVALGTFEDEAACAECQNPDNVDSLPEGDGDFNKFTDGEVVYEFSVPASVQNMFLAAMSADAVLADASERASKLQPYVDDPNVHEMLEEFRAENPDLANATSMEVLDAMFAPGTHDGPGWITNPRATERIRHYWTKGKGALRIKWGVPGDFNRCREQLAKYVQNPDWLAGLCANMHKEAIGMWPGQEDGGRSKHAITAAASPSVRFAPAPKAVLPHEFFEDPKLTKPTPLTITPEGRIYGHLATWGTCHVGMQGVCTTPPREYNNDYAHFRVGVVETDKGPVSTGAFVKGIGHLNDRRASAAKAMAHYDQSDAAFADVALGEDEVGLWYSGALRDGIPESELREIRATARMSGDWRPMAGKHHLIGASLVGMQGYPVPQMAIVASADGQGALIGAGMVGPEARQIGAITAGAFITPDHLAGFVEVVADAVDARLAMHDAKPIIDELDAELAAREDARLAEAVAILEG